MYQFFMNNWHILLTMYIVGAVLTFIGLIAFFYWIGKAEDEDREMYPEAYPEGNAGAFLSWAVGIGISVLLSAIWIGAPLIFIGVWLFGIIDEKFPELMGDFGDDTEEEQDND